MTDAFFEHPILNSPYEYPDRHWELDDQGQPTQNIFDSRRRADFITPIPKPRKRNGGKTEQQGLQFDEGKGLTSAQQQYDHIGVITGVREEMNKWRRSPGARLAGHKLSTSRGLSHRALQRNPGRRVYRRLCAEFELMLGHKLKGAEQQKEVAL